MTNQDQPKGQAELTEAQRILFEELRESIHEYNIDQFKIDLVCMVWDEELRAMERYAALKSNHVEEQPKESEWNDIRIDINLPHSMVEVKFSSGLVLDYDNKWPMDLVTHWRKKSRPKSEERETGWISVDTILPRKETNVIIKCTNHSVSTTGYIHERGHWIISNGMGTTYREDYHVVTHWMPMPVPPAKD